ncbi:hypothetical protein DERF_008049 [Dermatophagoides farinae]|uniref:Uncharacterized protein n=1 Tax=Dermatophagoides farinae TaxID=6954 RepID=A0A922HZH4_DERFA|nr:hypothetical protein DERF_008049 [Dermatophagoides farinae]
MIYFRLLNTKNSIFYNVTQRQESRFGKWNSHNIIKVKRIRLLLCPLFIHRLIGLESIQKQKNITFEMFKTNREQHDQNQKKRSTPITNNIENENPRNEMIKKRNVEQQQQQI